MNSESLAAWRRRRATATKALKRRDLDRGRVRRPSRKPLDPTDPIPDPVPVPPASQHTHTPRSDAHTSASDQVTTRPRFPPTILSPIIPLLAAQLPSPSPNRTSPPSVAPATGSAPAPPASSPALDRDHELQPPRPRTGSPPSSPSSSSERSQRPHSRSGSGTRIHARQSMAETDKGTTACERCEGKRWEALERRVEVMERKNLLLEAALLAVIDASAGVAVARGRRVGEGIAGL